MLIFISKIALLLIYLATFNVHVASQKMKQEENWRPFPESIRGAHNIKKRNADYITQVHTRPFSNQQPDCLKTERTKRFVSDCYTNDNPSQDDEYQFYSLWSEISSDFKYAFDFVLWDSYMPHRKENQFWFLISFLKGLAQTTEHPINILSRTAIATDHAKWNELLTGLNDRLTQHENRLKSWEVKLTEVSTTVAYFKGEMIILENKLNDLVVSLDNIQAHKEMMKKVLKDLNEQTQVLKELTEKFARAVLTMIVPLTERPVTENHQTATTSVETK